MKYRFFSEKEVENLNAKLAYKLDSARELAGIPFHISSGYRTEEENTKVGGVKNSSHVKGMAVDIKVANNQERGRIVKALLTAGIKRIGIYKAHIHADIDNEKPQPSIWFR